MRPLPLTSALLAAAFVGRATSAGPGGASLDGSATNDVAANLPVGGAANASAFADEGPTAGRST